jgi:UDP:flavonoid glycosyltransferase YjiC (YdhE family)
MKTKKILFACISFDGHFNPLTGMAIYLQQLGYDVRWYTGNIYKEKLKKLNIPHFPFNRAGEVTAQNMNTIYPQLHKIKTQVGKLQYSLKHFFVEKAPEYFEDIESIYQEFPFDVLVCDMLFTASLLVKEKLQVPVIGIGISPLASTSVDLAPPGLGMTPANGFIGRKKQAFLRFITRNVIFKEASSTYNQILKKYGLKPVEGVFIDAIIERSDLYLQSGVPGFDYQRRDMGKNIRYVGALLPHSNKKPQEFAYQDKLQRFKKVILVTQGTAEPDVDKLMIPTLEAFKDTEYLVVATTAGSQTQKLKRRYPQENIIIEDFIDYTYIMPRSDVYVTNGGYGGVLLAIAHHVPMVAAGVHEGKNEITARVGYFKLGINLQTELPSQQQIRQSVEKVLADSVYRKNVKTLAEEFTRYNAHTLCAKYFYELLYNSSQQEAKSGNVVLQP